MPARKQPQGSDNLIKYGGSAGLIGILVSVALQFQDQGVDAINQKTLAVNEAVIQRVEKLEFNYEKLNSKIDTNSEKLNLKIDEGFNFLRQQSKEQADKTNELLRRNLVDGWTKQDHLMYREEARQERLIYRAKVQNQIENLKEKIDKLKNP